MEVVGLLTKMNESDFDSFRQRNTDKLLRIQLQQLQLDELLRSTQANIDQLASSCSFIEQGPPTPFRICTNPNLVRDVSGKPSYVKSNLNTYNEMRQSATPPKRVVEARDDDIDYVPPPSFKKIALEKNREGLQQFFSDFYKKGRCEFEKLITSPRVDVYHVTEDKYDEYVLIWLEYMSQKEFKVVSLPKAVDAYFNKFCLVRTDTKSNFDGLFVLYPKSLPKPLVLNCIRTWGLSNSFEFDEKRLSQI